MSKPAPMPPPSASYERALFVIKIQYGLIGFLALVSAVLAGVLVAVFPLKETELLVYEFKSPGENFVQVQAAGQDMRANTALLDRFIREYVVNRETVDGMTEPERYAHVYSMNTKEENQRFRAAYGGEDALSNQKGFHRDVKILRTSRLDSGYYQVEFQTTDSWEFEPESEPKVNQWVATLAFGFSDQRTTYDKLRLNPLGLFVQQYSLSRRE